MKERGRGRRESGDLYYLISRSAGGPEWWMRATGARAIIRCGGRFYMRIFYKTFEDNYFITNTSKQHPELRLSPLGCSARQPYIKITIVWLKTEQKINPCKNP